MSQTPIPPGQPDDLQFRTVEPPTVATTIQPSARACAACKQPIQDTYYTVGNNLVCPRCRDAIAGARGGSSVGRLFKATAFGIGAGLVGALVWFLVRRFAHVQLGLLAVAVGYMVGRAVLAGSGNRGGRGYQILAVVLTYCSICANFMPDVIEEIVKNPKIHASAQSGSNGSPTSGTTAQPQDGSGTDGNTANSTPPKQGGVVRGILLLVVGVVLVFVLTLAIPFTGAMSPIGLLIAAFALWEAWKINTRRHLPVSGPYALSGGMPGAFRTP
ncbi:MAG: hypothetical protein JWN24_4490 [Phycisphaerales bacterium]|nr:hypothetical protein [Phycisphaerales bacterium]